MNQELIREMNNVINAIVKSNAEVLAFYAKPETTAEQKEQLVETTKKQKAMLMEVKGDKKKYETSYQNLTFAIMAYRENRTEENKACLDNAKEEYVVISNTLHQKYGVELEEKHEPVGAVNTPVKNDTTADATPTHKETSVEKEETKENKKGSGCLVKTLAVIGAVALLATAIKGCSDIKKHDAFNRFFNNDKNQTDALNPSATAEQEKGTFNDPTDTVQVQERADMYFANYLNEEYMKRHIDSKVQDIQDVTPQDLADSISVANGESPIYNDRSFNQDSLHDYSDRICKMFGSYLSLETDAESATVPYHKVFTDGSIEQTAQKQVDDVTSKMVEAMNANDYEAFKKYGVEYGKTILYQYIYDDFDPSYISINSSCPAYAKPFLYAMSTSDYRTKFIEYGELHNINICIPYCIDLKTGKTNEITLSALIAMLDYVPTAEYDDLLTRSGLTKSKVESLGNKYTGETAGNTFMREASEYHKIRLDADQSISLK